ncbi:hypothetical protein C2845_PM01G00500 [Panicum miliaceum]|uniref:DET1- and DDB1-associated protein 1 domain-containing protein n=1 Tax=Panicum miliaceum TaxID=4540 RepID=A0A3L6THD6_PANMI|nr:hypothetical protein C2845_PM01G00500 [Panicum miliaceum]
MGSPLGGWPSYNPHNFSQLVPADPSAQPSVGSQEAGIGDLIVRFCCSRSMDGLKRRSVTPATYIATHRTDPPPNQVITTEARNILLRHFYQKSEEKLRPKRAAPDNLAPENNNKQPRGPVADVGSQSNARS